MQKSTHLHFLLALGHKKVVVLKQQEQISIYSDDLHRYQNRLSMERLAEAVGVRSEPVFSYGPAPQKAGPFSSNNPAGNDIINV